MTEATVSAANSATRQLADFVSGTPTNSVPDKVLDAARDALAAYACGLDVAAKIAPALGPDHYFRGWHTTATAGIFAAVAIAARLWQLFPDATCHAFGLAASQSAGLTRNFGSMTKSFHVGHAWRVNPQADSGYGTGLCWIGGQHSFRSHQPSRARAGPTCPTTSSAPTARRGSPTSRRSSYRRRVALFASRQTRDQQSMRFQR